jgi:aspartate kinase
VQDELAQGKVVIVAGYQGVSYKKEVTTLGRGGSDTTAVALAAALDALRCEIYSDVEGIHSADPRLVPAARRLAEISYEEMQELAEAGATVLNAQAVEFAKDRGIAIYARAAHGGAGETIVRRFPPRQPGRIAGIASETGLVLLTLTGGSRALDRLLERLEALAVEGKQLLFGGGVAAAAQTSLLLSLENIHDFGRLREALASLDGLTLREGIGTVSAIGAGIHAHFANLRRCLAVLAAQGATPLGVSTSSFRISLLLEVSQVPPAVRGLHKELIEG